MSALKVKSELKLLANPEKAKFLKGFFKTGKGQYAEGNLFLGIKVPDQRKVAKKFKNLTLSEIKKLLGSRVHEHRLTALFILVNQYEKADLREKERLYNFYLENLDGVNNWDLVDSSCYKIVGDYLLDKPILRRSLYNMAKSKNLWERRIAIVSTYRFIKDGQLKDTLKISEILIEDEHDLIHKAAGWMLRELGKQDLSALESFLEEHASRMPRTMLRYSIEKMNKDKRSYFMSK